MLELKLAGTLTKLFALERLPVTFEVVTISAPVRARAISTRFGPDGPKYFFRRRSDWYVWDPALSELSPAPTALGLSSRDTVMSLGVLILRMLASELRGALFPLRGVDYFSLGPPELSSDEHTYLLDIHTRAMRLLRTISNEHFADANVAGIATLLLNDELQLIARYHAESGKVAGS